MQALDCGNGHSGAAVREITPRVGECMICQTTFTIEQPASARPEPPVSTIISPGVYRHPDGFIVDVRNGRESIRPAVPLVPTPA